MRKWWDCPVIRAHLWLYTASKNNKLVKSVFSGRLRYIFGILLIFEEALAYTIKQWSLKENSNKTKRKSIFLLCGRINIHYATESFQNVLVKICRWFWHLSERKQGNQQECRWISTQYRDDLWDDTLALWKHTASERGWIVLPVIKDQRAVFPPGCLESVTGPLLH